MSGSDEGNGDLALGVILRSRARVQFATPLRPEADVAGTTPPADGTLAAGLDLLEDLAMATRDPALGPALAAASRAEIARAATALSHTLGWLDDSISNPDLGSLASFGPGAFGAAVRRIADAYGARSACFSVSGSSGANIAIGMCLPRARLLLDRGAHLSVFGAAAFSGLETGYVARREEPRLGVQLPVSPDDVADALARAPGTGTVWITSPTYEGLTADIPALAGVCRRAGAKLIVDSAWGATHGLLSPQGFPASAVAQGADAAVVSLHKKGLGLSQASVALFNDETFAEAFDRVGHLGLITTSPLYLMVALTEYRVRQAMGPEGRAQWAAAIDAARAFAASVGRLPGIRPLALDALPPGIGADPCHVVLNVTQAALSGIEIQAALARRGFDIEMGTRDAVLMLFGPGNAHRWRELADALADVLAEAPSGRTKPPMPVAPLASIPEQLMRPQDAVFGPGERVAPDAAVGRIAGEVIGAYPPGQAIIAPGEAVTAEAIAFLRGVVRAGGRLKGVDDLEKTGIRVRTR